MLVRLAPVLILLAVGLAGCSAPDLALRPVAKRSVASGETTFNLPEPYAILDVTYTSALVALNDDPDLADVRERTTVQVFARHRETGEEVLFVYDLTLPDAGPTTVIRFRRVPEEPVRREEPVRTAPDRRW